MEICATWCSEFHIWSLNSLHFLCPNLGWTWSDFWTCFQVFPVLGERCIFTIQDSLQWMQRCKLLHAAVWCRLINLRTSLMMNALATTKFYTWTRDMLVTWFGIPFSNFFCNIDPPPKKKVETKISTTTNARRSFIRWSLQKCWSSFALAFVNWWEWS